MTDEPSCPELCPECETPIASCHCLKYFEDQPQLDELLNYDLIEYDLMRRIEAGELCQV